MSKTKSFKTDNNPAMSFISGEDRDRAEGKKTEKPKKTEEKRKPAGRKAPEGYKPNPEFIEKKSKRVQLLVQPSLHTEAKAICDELGVSLNDFIHRAIQEACYNDYVRGLITKDIQEER